jgi:leucyl aminopeptidase
MVKKMLFSCVADLDSRKDAELLVLPFWEGPKKVREAADITAFKQIIKGPIDVKDFKAEKGETSLIYLSKGKEKRCLLLGLGKEGEVSIESLRQSYCLIAKFCQTKGISRINVLLPNIAHLKGINLEGCLTGIAEGLLLTNYVWHQLIHLDEETVLLESICLVGVVPTLALSHLERLENIAKGVYLARDLINGNADQVTPQYLADVAMDVAKKNSNVTATIFDKKHIEKEKMGLLLAVSRGSMNDPAFIILSYKGNPRSKDHTVVIGKGVTYDTGGLNLKPTGFMETMREDMSGSAAALATVSVAAELKLAINVTAVVAATENSIDGRSYKPGDVYVGYSGKSVEIGNTDAEGRLTLADAIGYTVKNLAPTRIIDFATLTGAMVVALGEGLSGLFCNNETLAQALLSASAYTYEPLWQMPLHAPYKELLKSDIADLKNIGGKAAGSITAALFLEHFVEDVPWAHIDIAGTAFLEKERHYWPKHAVGFGVRLMIQFLSSLKK